MLKAVHKHVKCKWALLYIERWLTAPLEQDGQRIERDCGTPQGGVAQRWQQREATGDMIIVRYADDVVVGFEREEDARRFLDAMRARLEEFALSLHPDKTRLIEFGRFAAVDRKKRGLGKPETFTFLGFTFICGKTRKGRFQLQRKTRSDRMRAKLKDIKAELRRRMHWPIPEQGKWLRQVVTGHFAYYAVPTNGRKLSAFRHHVTDLWRRTLRRRSRRDGFTWARMTKLTDDWLPKPRILHPWPSDASPSATQGRSRVLESGSLGSERRAPSNGRPYRESATTKRSRLACVVRDVVENAAKAIIALARRSL
ncbi:reverse transcriptase domain-containing protein [Rhizobium sp. 2YAF20]|uniref:reverse transcriptase domain-containing protein n=1 Tax=Rhizobium sp. 2YAF20 TaxID=3233027 RepID=UPI003F9E84C4